MRTLIVVCLLGWLLLPHTAAQAAPDDSQIDALVDRLQNSSDWAASRDAFTELRQMLGTAPAETVAATQARLCRALWVSNDALAIRRMTLVLSAAPCEDAMIILARRLGSNLPPAMTMAVCSGIHALGAGRPVLSPATVTFALERLDAVARNGRLPGAVIESAIMATAAFGGPGFDQLMKLKTDPKAPLKIHTVMYSALGETDDPRALAVLRQAVADPSNSESSRAQASHGLGQLFSRAASAGRTIDPAEQDACISVLKMHLDETTPDRLFASALTTLAMILDVQQDTNFQRITLGALKSASRARREAALEALHRHDGPLDSGTSTAVRQLADSDSAPDVRSAAAAVLDKQQSLQPAPASGEK